MHNRKSGFTLIELLVVLGLITIISSITFGAFRSVTDGNKRTSCQSNMSQVYQSVRLYSQDFEGNFPYLNPVVDPLTDPPSYVAPDGPATPAGGIGLWGLYTFRVVGNDLICPNNDVNLPLADEGARIGLSGYVRSSKIFHCPADRFEKVVQYRPTPGAACVTTATPVLNSQFSFVDNAGNKRLNPSYLSYQTNDDAIAIPSVTPRMTYSSFRRSETGSPNRIRQLIAFETSVSPPRTLERPIDQATVIAWCRFHRSLNIKENPNGVTVNGQRNFDNVLFSDGSVQSLPMKQTVRDSAGNELKDHCTGWQRVRREKAENMTDPSTCTP